MKNFPRCSVFTSAVRWVSESADSVIARSPFQNKKLALLAKILQDAANAVLSGLQKNRKKAFARPSFNTVYLPGVPLIGQTQNMEAPEVDGRR